MCLFDFNRHTREIFSPQINPSKDSPSSAASAQPRFLPRTPGRRKAPSSSPEWHMCEHWYFDKCHSEPEGTPCSCGRRGAERFSRQFEGCYLPADDAGMLQAQNLLLEDAERRGQRDLR